MFIGKQPKKTPRKTFPCLTASQRIMIQISAEWNLEDKFSKKKKCISLCQIWGADGDNEDKHNLGC